MEDKETGLGVYYCRSKSETRLLDVPIGGFFYCGEVSLSRIIKGDKGKDIAFGPEITYSGIFMRVESGVVGFNETEYIRVSIMILSYDADGMPIYEKFSPLFALENPEGIKVNIVDWRLLSDIDFERRSMPKSVQRVESLKEWTEFSIPEDYGVWAITIDSITHEKEMVWLTGVECVMLDKLRKASKEEVPEIRTVTLAPNKVWKARRVFAVKKIWVLNHEIFEGKEVYILQGQEVLVY